MANTTVRTLSEPFEICQEPAIQALKHIEKPHLMSSMQSKRDFVQTSSKSISFGMKACFRFIEPKLDNAANKTTQDESP